MTRSFKVFAFSVLLVVAHAVGSVAFAQTVVTNPASPWVVPAGVTTVTVECWGAGGGGGGAQTNANGSAAGGGGGGAYSMQVITVSGGQSYTVTVGAGGNGGS